MGFLTNFRASRTNAILQRLLRVFQFLSAIVSLGLFSSRLYKIIRLYHRATASNGAVEGILAAAALYTLTAMLLNLCLKGGGPKPLRWLLILLDVLFVGGFIAVAYLTRPHGGSSGPCNNSTTLDRLTTPKGQNCKLPWGTFVLAIISTIMHFLTAVFHEIRDHHKAKKERDQYVDDRESRN